MNPEPPTCDKCGSTDMAEQPGDIFPGLLLCREDGCKGMYLTEQGARLFEQALEDAWVANKMRVTRNN